MLSVQERTAASRVGEVGGDEGVAGHSIPVGLFRVLAFWAGAFPWALYSTLTGKVRYRLYPTKKPRPDKSGAFTFNFRYCLYSLLRIRIVVGPSDGLLLVLNLCPSVVSLTAIGGWERLVDLAEGVWARAGRTARIAMINKSFFISLKLQRILLILLY
jgi:hypothetical protein